MLLLYILFYTVSATYGEVLRIPCRRHGNFSVRHKEQYMSQVTVLEKFLVDTVTECVLRCIGHDTCQHVNYHYNDDLCELLDEGEGVLVNTTAAEHLATESDKYKHGPLCKSIEPCGVLEECFDTCEDLGYRCQQIGMVLKNNNIVKTIPVLTKTWRLSIDIAPTEIKPQWTNIFHATTNNDAIRLPSIYVPPNSFILEFCSIINKLRKCIHTPANLPMNVFTNVRIEQIFDGEKYNYRVYVDGKNVFESVNNDVEEYSNVTVYASNPWYNSAGAIVKILTFGRPSWSSILS